MSPTISLFFRKMIASVLKFSCDKRFKDWTSLWYNSESSKLAGSKLASFMFVYIHFNVPPTRITDLIGNVSDEKIYWYGTVTFVYVFAFFSLVCVQSVIQLMNTPFITFVFMIKDFSISFSRVVIVQDFETVTFYVLFVYKPTFSVIFCWMKRLRVSSQFNSLFILYISTAEPFSLLVRGYNEVKISKHEIW